MADEDLNAAIRLALADVPGLSETRMFGGLCFLVNGNMLCGTYCGMGMYRVGKAHEAAALALPSTRPMEMTGRRMPGMVEVDAAGITDPGLRAQLIALALDFAGSLPPKAPKTPKTPKTPKQVARKPGKQKQV
jgi:hypothetical protein